MINGVDIDKIITFYARSEIFKVFLCHIIIESKMCALVLLNLLNSLQKRDQMLIKPCILSLSPSSTRIYLLKGMFTVLNILLQLKINISLNTYLILINHSFIC